MSCTYDHWHPTSKQRLMAHMVEVHIGKDAEQMSKAELQRLHGKLRVDTKCGWSA